MNNNIANELYFLQKIGDLTPDLLHSIPGLENINDTLAFLKKNYDYISYPIVRSEVIGLNRYLITIYSNYILNLRDIYTIFDESTGHLFRNVLNPYVINILLYTTLREEAFVKVLDYLQDYDIIYYYTVDKIYDQYTYPIDYSHFDFDTKQFKIRRESREPFTPPRYNPDGKIDRADIDIITAKQRNPRLDIEEIAKELKISVSEAINHLREHVNYKGLISSYLVTLRKPNFVLLASFEEKNTIDYLSKIPELYLIFQTKSGYLAYILGENENVLSYTNHVTRIKRKDQVEITINPIDEDHALMSSIPSKYFISERQWSFSIDSMINKVENTCKNWKRHKLL